MLKGYKMKVIFKPKKIDTYEAVKITEEMIGTTLTDTPTLKQELCYVDNELVLKAHEIDSNDVYYSEQDMKIFVKVGDYLIKTDKGYTKPIYPVFELDSKLEKVLNDK